MDYLKILLPIIVTGLILIVVIKIVKNKSVLDNKEETYMNEGIVLGMCLGAGIGASFGTYIGYFISAGLLIGCVVGIGIKK